MSVDNALSARRIYRVVYAGPEGSGKTTTLLALHRLSKEPVRGQLRYLTSRHAPKSTIDYLALDLGKVNGLRTTARLYTVPGHKEGNAVLSRMVRGATSIVFVADSRIDKVGANLDFIYEFRTNVLASASIDGTIPPIIYQFNKSDLASTVEPSRIAEILGIGDEPYFATSAIDGTGVFVPLKTAIERSMWFVNTRQATGVSAIP
jgi:signal recognition particle receptor subunit beta